MDYKFINIEYLNTVSGGDPDIISEIVVMFKEQSVDIYKEMKNQLFVKKYNLLGSLAHKAKSSVLIMGMNDLAIMLKSLEVLAKEGKESELFESYIERFRTETDGAVTELEDFINNNIKRN
jgi:HPt (histidine-containing phosphotransfer) domain-containing protein